MSNNLQSLISTASALGATQVMVQLGITSGEISQREGRRIYGKWFSDADKEGRIHPCRVEDGRAGTRWYKVTDILSLKTQDYARAELKY